MAMKHPPNTISPGWIRHNRKRIMGYDWGYRTAHTIDFTKKWPAPRWRRIEMFKIVEGRWGKTRKWK